MIFKTLVECILKQIRDPDNNLTLNALHTVIREIKHDLMQAFMLSRPLVDRHSNLFWESRSYLDFLINIAQLPLATDYFQRPPSPGALSEEDSFPTDSGNDCHWRTQLDTCQHDLDECREQKKQLEKSVCDLERQLGVCDQSLSACSTENKRLQGKMDYLNPLLKQTVQKLNRLEENVSKGCQPSCPMQTALKKCQQELEECRRENSERDEKGHDSEASCKEIVHLQDNLKEAELSCIKAQDDYEQLLFNWRTCLDTLAEYNQYLYEIQIQQRNLWLHNEKLMSMFKTLQTYTESEQAKRPEFNPDWIQLLQKDSELMVQNHRLKKRNKELKTSFQAHETGFKQLQDKYSKYVFITERDASTSRKLNESTSSPLESKCITWPNNVERLPFEDEMDTDQNGIECDNAIETSTFFHNDTLEKECIKLAEFFNIVLTNDSFYNDLINSHTMKQYIRESESLTSLNQQLENYFKVSNINMPHLIHQIDTILQQLTSHPPILVSDGNDFKSNFATHVSVYWNAITESLTKWNNDYDQWLKQLNLQVGTTREKFINEIQKQRNEWYRLYNQWLDELKLEADTPREEFLEKLKTYQLREKRLITLSESYEVSSGKKLKLEYNWTDTEIQNLFSALYKDFFTLKWRVLNNMNPIDADLIDKLKQKLELLEQMQSTSRDNLILNICMQYVKLDLAVLGQKTELFMEMTSRDNLLEISMKQTEEYL